MSISLIKDFLVTDETLQRLGVTNYKTPTRFPWDYFLEISSNHFWAENNGGGRDAAFGSRHHCVCRHLLQKKSPKRSEDTGERRHVPGWGNGLNEVFFFLNGPRTPPRFHRVCHFLFGAESAPIGCLERSKLSERQDAEKTSSSRLVRPPRTSRGGSRSTFGRCQASLGFNSLMPWHASCE